MRHALRIVWVGWMLLGAAPAGFAADMTVDLSSNDGSTEFSIQNAAAGEVASVDSLGRATFSQVSQTGSGGSFILNQNSLQSGATIYVSSGTANTFNIGATGTIAGRYRIGAIEGVTESNNPLFQFASATVNGSLVIDFTNVGLRDYGSAPLVLLSPVFNSDSNTAVSCNAHTITTTGMTIECVQIHDAVLGNVVEADATNRDIAYLLMGTAP